MRDYNKIKMAFKMRSNIAFLASLHKNGNSEYFPIIDDIRIVDLPENNKEDEIIRENTKEIVSENTETETVSDTEIVSENTETDTVSETGKNSETPKNKENVSQKGFSFEERLQEHRDDILLNVLKKVNKILKILESQNVETEKKKVEKKKVEKKKVEKKETEEEAEETEKEEAETEEETEKEEVETEKKETETEEEAEETEEETEKEEVDTEKEEVEN